MLTSFPALLHLIARLTLGLEIWSGRVKMGGNIDADVDQSLGRTFKDLSSGAAGGVAQVLLGLSTLYLKVFMQALDFFCRSSAFH